MNKETRQFIWGLILMVVCTYGTFSFYSDLKTHLAFGTTVGQLVWDVFMVALEAFGVFMGACYVLKNTVWD